MARKYAKPKPPAEPLWEVLARNDLGRETVERVNAASPDDAAEAVADRLAQVGYEVVDVEAYGTQSRTGFGTSSRVAEQE